MALESSTPGTTSHLSLGGSAEQLSSVVSQATPSCLPSSLPRPGSTHIFSVTQRWLMAGAGTRLSLPGSLREQIRQRLRRAGSEEPGGQGAWESGSEFLAALFLPHPPKIALSVTPAFQNTPFGISQLWASVSLYIKKVGG